MTSLTTLTLDIDASGIATVTLARPDVLNAFNETMIAEITETFALLSMRDDVHAIVLASAGRAFSAGADLDWMRRASTNPEAENLADAQRFAAMMHTIARCSKPIVARVPGVAFGGGVGLICACDIAVASSNAVFSVSEARFGILPAVIGPYLVNAVGLRQAKRLALSAERIDATAAHAIGLVHRVVPLEQLDAAVSAVVADLKRNGPRAMSEIKRLFAGFAEGPITADVRDFTASTIARVRAGDEAREGFAAFFDKRDAAWTRR